MLGRSHRFLGITSTFWVVNGPCSRTQHGLTRVGLEPPTSGSGVRGINHQVTVLPTVRRDSTGRHKHTTSDNSPSTALQNCLCKSIFHARSFSEFILEMMMDNYFTYFYNRNCLSLSSLLSINTSSVRTITFRRWLIRNAVYHTFFTKFSGLGIGCCCLRFMSLLPIECQLENKMAAVFSFRKIKC